MYKNDMLRALLTAVISAALLFTALDADAGRKKARKKKKVEPVAAEEVKPTPPPDPMKSPLQPGAAFDDLKGVPFGGDMAALTEFVRKNIDAAYRPRILGTPDVRVQDQLKAEAEKELEAFSKTTVEFRGQKSGYDVSILSGEFRHNARQSMRSIVAKDSQTYFMLSEGALWKVLRQVPSNGGAFGKLTETMTKAYGPGQTLETTMVYDGPDAREVPKVVQWEKDGLTVTVSDLSALYKSHMIKWAVTDVERRVSAMAKGGPGSLTTQFKTSDALADIKGDDDEEDVDDIVDKLLAE